MPPRTPVPSNKNRPKRKPIFTREQMIKNTIRCVSPDILLGFLIAGLKKAEERRHIKLLESRGYKITKA